MECMKEALAVAYVCEELEASETARISHHLSTCSACARLVRDLRGIGGGLAADSGEFDDPELTRDIMTLIDMGRGQAAELPRMSVGRRASRWAPLAAAALLLTGVGLWLVQHPPLPAGMSGVTARGADETGDEWVSLELFLRERRGAEAVYLPLRDEMERSASVAVAYTDRAENPYPYLMVFAVDSERRIHWYYPAYTDEQENPMSVPIKRGEQVLLPDEVAHELALGPLVFFGLFSVAPLRVKQVEEEVNRQLDRHGAPTKIGRLDFEGAGQWSDSIVVIDR